MKGYIFHSGNTKDEVMNMYKSDTGNCMNMQSIDLQSMKSYEEDGRRLKEVLEECKANHIKIAFHNKTVEPEWMTAVYKMIIDRTREELKAEQYKGIKKALKKKAEGTGSYGRPRTKLPPDFEKQLKLRIKNQEDLSKYCKEIEMKKSTFYKWVKIYRESWNIEELKSR